MRLLRCAPWLLVLLGATISVAAYLQALHYPFVSDDITYVVTNKELAELPASELWRLMIKPYTIGFEFLPLRDFSYWMDINLFGRNPAGYRLHNILLYLLCLPLMFAVTASLWRYFRPADRDSAPWAAAVVTFLFAMHPALVESVVWISGRKYVLPGLFSMLALWLALGVGRKSGFSSRHAVLTLVAFIAVMFSKSSYVGIAPLIAVLWLAFWLDLEAPHRKWRLLLWPAGILLLAVFLLAVFIIDNLGVDPVPAYFGMESVARTLAVLGDLFRISITPEARHYYRPVFEDPLFPAMILLGACILLAAGWGGMAFLRRRSMNGFAVLSFLLLCLPYLQIFPAKPPSMVADRYVELAIWPVIFLIVSLLWKMKPPVRVLIMVLMALPWIFQTMERTRDWASMQTIENIDTRAFPGYYLPALYTIRNTYLSAGRYREAQKLADGVEPAEIRDMMTRMIRLDEYLRKDTAADPLEAANRLLDYRRRLARLPPEAKWNSSMYYAWLRLTEIVAEEWEYLSILYPHDTYVRYNAGLYFFDFGIYWKAEAHLHEAIKSGRLPPAQLGVAFLELGTMYAKTGRLQEAEKVLHAALSLPQPAVQAYCVLADVYGKSGRSGEALQAAEQCPGRKSQ